MIENKKGGKPFSTKNIPGKIKKNFASQDEISFSIEDSSKENI